MLLNTGSESARLRGASPSRSVNVEVNPVELDSSSLGGVVELFDSSQQGFCPWLGVVPGLSEDDELFGTERFLPFRGWLVIVGVAVASD